MSCLEGVKRVKERRVEVLELSGGLGVWCEELWYRSEIGGFGYYV